MSTATDTAPLPPGLSADLLRRLDVPGPRYTSYPTADRFSDGFGPADLQAAIQRAWQAADAADTSGAGAVAGRPLSLYVHIPFCASVCYYCACNKVVTRKRDQVAGYLDALSREMALHASLRGGRRVAVSQLHFGGGTPTFLTDGELDGLMQALRGCFEIAPGAEMSIEVDPRTVTPERLAHLASLGFNRLSLGVQDFDEAVQRAIHRLQPHEAVRSLVEAARELGFESINLDLIHGLPLQTPASFARTLAQVQALRPDRIALYAYAHLPLRFKAQRRIHEAELPGAGARVQMLGAAIAGLLAEGYEYIGMDHFALPTDALAVAKRQGRLHRNFQGYSTQAGCELIGLGVSAIGETAGCYTQNAKELPAYLAALAEGRLPIVRGLVPDAEDRLRRQVIMALMCQGRVDFGALSREHGFDVAHHFAPELAQLPRLAEDGLVAWDGEVLGVTSSGWFFVRAVAMVFDRHLRSSRGAAGFSRVV